MKEVLGRKDVFKSVLDERAKMTAILGLITPRFVILIADRRITRMVRSESGALVVENQDDTATKSIYLDGRFIMGFTGVAQVDGEPIEKWVCDLLVDHNPTDYFEFLAKKIGEAFERGNLRFRHCFLAVGFDSDMLPQVVRESNYHDLDGNVADDRYFRPFSFTTSRTALDGTFSLVSVGSVEVPRSLKPWLYKKFRKGSESVSGCTVALLRALREMSEISRGTIGTACVVTSIPRDAVPVGLNPVMLNYPNDTELMKLHVSFSVPDAKTGPYALLYNPAMWAPDGHSGYGYSSVIGAGDDFVSQIRNEFSRDPDKIYPVKARSLPGGMGLLEDFPHHV